ncbi:hypothetical protein LX36DRAFT_651567 [Colletotrichum falcatum]|nr:hypothetical protein LX36DRAFT_651567 [Colletotrichum falcatum]
MSKRTSSAITNGNPVKDAADSLAEPGMSTISAYAVQLHVSNANILPKPQPTTSRSFFSPLTLATFR